MFMVGGTAADVARVRPLLDAMGRAVHHVGALGAGHAMKCINNLITAITFSATMEGLVIGKRYGLDPAAMVEVLDESTGGSWITQNHIRQRVLSRSFDDPFKLELMLKDMGIALELGREAQLPLPLSGLGLQLWRAAALAAGPGASVSELARWVEQQAGTAVDAGCGLGGRTMSTEQAFADFVCTLQAGDVPADARRIVRQVLLAATGAALGRRRRGRHRGTARAAARSAAARRRRRASSSATACRPAPRRSSTARCAARSTTATRWRRASTSARR